MGWVYNLKDQNAPTRAPRMIAICMTFSVIALLAVILRFYVRIRTKKGAWVDDYAALAGALLGSAYSALAVVQTRWGQALDAAYFPQENVIPFSKVQYAGGPIYTLALLGFKISLLTSYLRIGGFVPLYRYVIYGAIVAVSCNQFIFTLVISLACHPVSKQWDSSEPGWCIDTIKSYYAIAGTSIGFDLIIIILPMPVLWRLQLHLTQKIVLCSLFGLGFFITAIQIIRIFTIANLRNYTDSEAIIIWSCVEVSLGVIVACVPTYGPLFLAWSSRFNSFRSRPIDDQSFPLSPQAHRAQDSGQRRKKGSEIRTQEWEYSLHDRRAEEQGVHTTTIKSLAKSKVQADASSEEHILQNEHDQRSDTSHGPMQIHTKVEVHIETHNGDSIDGLDR